jgi:hypothetical protein
MGDRKWFSLCILILSIVIAPTLSHGFLDYLFSGSASRDAIDNSAVGDLRAWWTGNPAYQFNPYYSGPAQPQQNPGQNQAQQPAQAPPQINYYPPQGGGYPQPAQQQYSAYPQGQPQPAQQPYPQQMPQQQYPMTPQQYQGMQQQAQTPQYQGMQQPAQQYQPGPQQQFYPGRQ